MIILKKLYKLILKKEPPYYYNYSLLQILKKPFVKHINVVIIPNIPFNCVRIALYRAIGYRIGKHTFIGMKCYLDDLCKDKINIGNNVTISYGVYVACHGKNQGHNTLTINDGAYIGMRANIVARYSNGIVVGKNAILGACTLVNDDVPDNATVVGVPMRIIRKEIAND